MPHLVAEMEDINRLQQKLISNEQKLQEVLERLQAIERTPVQWLSRSATRQYFITEGKPVSASTFNGWVKKWLDNGTLIQNVNCKFAGDTLLISSDFLRTGNHNKSITQLKKVG